MPHLCFRSKFRVTFIYNYNCINNRKSNVSFYSLYDFHCSSYILIVTPEVYSGHHLLLRTYHRPKTEAAHNQYEDDIQLCMTVRPDASFATCGAVSDSFTGVSGLPVV